MTIHDLYKTIFKIWREKRMQKFENIIDPQPLDRILDVGGYPHTWNARPQKSKSIECMNIQLVPYDPSDFPNHQILTIEGNGCDLQYEDQSYEIAFSNSVIEHVGEWEQQIDFAKEIRRVGKRIWVQTPALECPIEPHYLAPFVHWFPVPLRRKVLRWSSPWGWMQKPTQVEIDQSIKFTKLWSKSQFKELFPDCEIITERILWIFPKSYIAYRIN